MCCRFIAAVFSLVALAQLQAAANEPATCMLSDEEALLAKFLEQHPDQSREDLVCDPRLMDFARSRAKDMADRDYFGHVTPDRKGPNALLRATGYEIPKYYVGGVANSIESILGGERSPAKAWRLLTESPVHRKHLLGQGETYAEQTHYGVAYLHQPESQYAHYWVVVIVKPGAAERPMTCTPAPPVCIVH